MEIHDVKIAHVRSGGITLYVLHPVDNFSNSARLLYDPFDSEAVRVTVCYLPKQEARDRQDRLERLIDFVRGGPCGLGQNPYLLHSSQSLLRLLAISNVE